MDGNLFTNSHMSEFLAFLRLVSVSAAPDLVQLQMVVDFNSGTTF